MYKNNNLSGARSYTNPSLSTSPNKKPPEKEESVINKTLHYCNEGRYSQPYRNDSDGYTTIVKKDPQTGLLFTPNYDSVFTDLQQRIKHLGEDKLGKDEVPDLSDAYKYTDDVAKGIRVEIDDTIDEIDKVRLQVVGNSENITSISRDLGTKTSQISDLQSRANTLEDTVSDHSTEIDNNRSNIAANIQSIISLQQAASSHDQDIAAIKQGNNNLSAGISSNEQKIKYLYGGEGADYTNNKSVRQIASEVLAETLIPESAKESLDTLQEIAAWIQNHPDDVTAINANISVLENKFNYLSTTKVDQITGKGLSTYDFNDYYLNMLENTPISINTGGATYPPVLVGAAIKYMQNNNITGAFGCIFDKDPSIQFSIKNAYSTKYYWTLNFYSSNTQYTYKDYIDLTQDYGEGYGITFNSGEIYELSAKVDKEAGKSLTSNDFTDAYKTQLDSLDSDINNKLANAVDLTSDQTISGTKTFESSILIGPNRIYNDSSNRLNFYYGNDVKLKIGSVESLLKGNFTPDSSNAYSLGRSGLQWKDLYLSNTLTDGTNAVTVANIVTADTEQTITGKKLFADNVSPYKTSGRYWTLGESNNPWDKAYVTYLHAPWSGSTFGPQYDNSYDLGTSSRLWRNIYVKGLLSDGETSVSIANLSTLNTDQTIDGVKTFNSRPVFSDGIQSNKIHPIGQSTISVSGGLVVVGNLQPDGLNIQGYTLGQPLAKWKKLYLSDSIVTGDNVEIPVNDIVSVINTSSNITGLLNDKVDKVDGKGLSTNDYTDFDKNKVDYSPIPLSIVGNSTSNVLDSAISYFDTQGYASALFSINGDLHNLLYMEKSNVGPSSARKFKWWDFKNNRFRQEADTFITTGSDPIKETQIFGVDTSSIKNYVDNEIVKVKQQITEIDKIEFKVVSELPTENISTSTVYLLGTDNDYPYAYDEYIYLNEEWELLGRQFFDLSGYVTIESFNSKIKELEDKHDDLDKKYASTGTKYVSLQGDQTIAGVKTFEYRPIIGIPDTYSEAATLDDIPTKVSQLTNDSGFLTTHQDISNKADKSEIPTKTSQLTNDSGFITQIPDTSDFVDKTSDQEINGIKTFNKRPIIKSAIEIPSEYQRISYIESSGQQVIDTGFYPSGGRFQIDMSFRYTQPNNSLSIFGNNNTIPFSITVYGPTPSFYVGSSQGFQCGPDEGIPRGFDHNFTAIADNGELTTVWNGDIYKRQYEGNIYTGQSLAIFGTRTGGGGYAETGNGYRLYSFKITDSNIVVRNFYPVRHLNNGSIGLYDIVTKQFYPDVNGGTFAYGEDIIDSNAQVATINNIPTNVSQLVNDVGYLNKHQDISGKADRSELFSKDYNDLTNKPTIPTKTSQLTNDSNFATTSYVDNAIAGIEIPEPSSSSTKQIIPVEINSRFAVSDSSEDITANMTSTELPSTSTGRLRGIAFGNGIFVSVNASGGVEYTSNDLVTWNKANSFTSNALTSVTYGKGMFACTEYINSGGGNIYKSTDGVNWELTYNFSESIEGIIYANGKFVVVGTNGLIALSEDLKDFTKANTNTAASFISITYGQNKYVAVTSSGVLKYSLNGEDWFDCSIEGDTTHYRSAAYGRGIFVIGGAKGTIRYSYDGLNWSSAVHNSSASLSYVRNMLYHNGKFFAALQHKEIWTSIDGANWKVEKSCGTAMWALAAGEYRDNQNESLNKDYVYAGGDSSIRHLFDLNISWLDYEPKLNSGEVLWQKQYISLSDGSIVESEVEVHTNMKNIYEATLNGAILAEYDPTQGLDLLNKSVEFNPEFDVDSIPFDDLNGNDYVNFVFTGVDSGGTGVIATKYSDGSITVTATKFYGGPAYPVEYLYQSGSWLSKTYTWEENSVISYVPDNYSDYFKIVDKISSLKDTIRRNALDIENVKLKNEDIEESVGWLYSERPHCYQIYIPGSSISAFLISLKNYSDNGFYIQGDIYSTIRIALVNYYGPSNAYFIATVMSADGVTKWKYEGGDLIETTEKIPTMQEIVAAVKSELNGSGGTTGGGGTND